MQHTPLLHRNRSSVTIQPSLRQYWCENIGFIFVFFFAIGLSSYLFFLESPYALYSSIFECIILLSLAYKYFTLKSFVWTITDEVIYQRHGLTYVTTDQLELYRIIDYQEVQTPLQQIFKIKSIILVSTDKTTPHLLIKGVPVHFPLMSIIRDRVEMCKSNKRIYEVTNP